MWTTKIKVGIWNGGWYFKKKYQEQAKKLYLESTKNYNLNVGVVVVSYTLVNKPRRVLSIILGIKT